MKILRYVAVIIWWVYLPDMTVSAQDIHISDPYANYPAKKAMYDEYSHWSIGLMVVSLSLPAISAPCHWGITIGVEWPAYKSDIRLILSSECVCP